MKKNKKTAIAALIGLIISLIGLFCLIMHYNNILLRYIDSNDDSLLGFSDNDI